MSKIKLKKTPEQIELVKALASRKPSDAEDAQFLFAEFVGDILRKYIDLAPTIGNLYEQLSVSEYEPQTLSLDDYYDVDNAGHYSVWSQSIAGGLATNLDYQTDEIPFQTYTLFSAISMYQKYIRAGRVDHVSKAINHLANEILFKREHTSVSPVLAAIAAGTTNGHKHVFRTATANQLVLDDFNKLLVRASRLLSANVGGTPLGASNGVTDCVISPEMLGQIRAMAYEPMNTRGVPDSVESTAVPMTEQFRNEVFRSAGIPTFYDINFLVAHELGDGQPYSRLFKNYAGATTYGKFDGSSASAFDADADDLIIAINAASTPLVKPVITDAETGQGLNVYPDSQFTARQRKVGFYAEVDEGALVTDDRKLLGLIV